METKNLPLINLQKSGTVMPSFLVGHKYRFKQELMSESYINSKLHAPLSYI